jgi:hypothetical protein
MTRWEAVKADFFRKQTARVIHSANTAAGFYSIMKDTEYDGNNMQVNRC